MDALEVLTSRGAVLLDHHFVHKSGKHGPHYINMDVVFPEVQLMAQVCMRLTYPFRHESVDIVAGAATGGIPLVYLTAKAMSGYTKAVWADKQDDDFVFGRSGFAAELTGKNVVIVTDLLNTGDTTKKIIAQVREHGGNIIGVSVICSQGSETAESLDVPKLHQLSAVDFQVFEADSCPLCEQSVPIVSDIGHGDTFQEAHPDYTGGFTKLLGA